MQNQNISHQKEFHFSNNIIFLCKPQSSQIHFSLSAQFNFRLIFKFPCNGISEKSIFFSLPHFINWVLWDLWIIRYLRWKHILYRYSQQFFSSSPCSMCNYKQIWIRLFARNCRNNPTAWRTGAFQEMVVRMDTATMGNKEFLREPQSPQRGFDRNRCLNVPSSTSKTAVDGWKSRALHDDRARCRISYCPSRMDSIGSRCGKTS